MAEETRRVPAFLSGPTTATAVLLPLRLYVGYFWLKLGLTKLNAGWLATDQQHLPDVIESLTAPRWFEYAFLEAANENVYLFQWLIVIFEMVFGALMLAGGVVRVAGIGISVVSVVAFILTRPDHRTSAPPEGLIALTLAVASAGRYLGLDAILRARLVKVPLF